MNTSAGSFPAPISASKSVTDASAVRVPWTVWACVSASILIAIGTFPGMKPLAGTAFGPPRIC